jgi:glutathionyl-hydroquinone reductase
MSITALSEVSAKGSFERSASTFRTSTLPPSTLPGRYHLYVSLACPWANGALAVLRLKGLDGAVGVSVVHPTWQRTSSDDQHEGWVFRHPIDSPVMPLCGAGLIDCADCVPDPHYKAKAVRDLYIRADPNYTGKYTVPVLWDTVLHTIVNNESIEIMKILNEQLNHLAKYPELDLYPQQLRQEIDSTNACVYEQINNGVYRCGFAKSQSAYDEAIDQLYQGLDRAEEILSKNDFLVGNRFTLVDIRLFMTLVRFDEVYIVYFKCNQKAISSYPSLLKFCKRIYSMDPIRACINMDHIKKHYFTSHKTLNPYAIIPKGPNFLGMLE